MKPTVRVGQVWRDPYSRHTDDLRLVRIDKIETRKVKQTILGMTREISFDIARVSSKTGNETNFTPINRFIKVARFGRFYKLYKDN